jgi:hypothetical protein
MGIFNGLYLSEAEISALRLTFVEIIEDILSSLKEGQRIN